MKKGYGTVRMIFLTSICLLALAIGSSPARPRPTAPPVLGAWRFVGTAPPGFVRQGTEVARLTFRLQRGRLFVLVATGKQRYNVAGQYVAAKHEILLTVPAKPGIVHLQATLGQGRAGAARMIGLWSDAHGDDGGFVLLRL